VEAFVTAAMTGDLTQTSALAAEFLAATESRTALVTDLLGAAQLLVDRRWRVGEARSEDEFRVSQAIAAAVSSLPPPPPPPAGLVQPQALLITMRAEEHHLGLDLAAAALADDGWEIDKRYGMELGDLIDVVAQGRFRMVGISSTYSAPDNATRLTTAVRAVQAMGKPVLAGGQAFARDRRLAEVVSPDITGADPRTAAVVARRFRSREWRRWSRNRGSTGA
jgi:methylmalonyl-CoA mutase cobalamin-binding subunit